jgi:hypothetical protein
LSRSKKEREKMATTIRELINILEKYEDPNKTVVWQYYTISDFDEEITNEQFGKVADRLDSDEIFTYAYEAIQEQIWELENKKGNK